MLYSPPLATGLINIILFSITTYYLLSNETASFYKNRKESSPKDTDWYITGDRAGTAGCAGLSLRSGVRSTAVSFRIDPPFLLWI